MRTFEEIIKEKKEFINSQELSEEFKIKLNRKIKLKRDKSKTVRTLINKKMIAAFVCFIIVSGVTIGSNTNRWFEILFSNKIKEIDDIENLNEKNIKEVDYEYVTNNGISIKPEYIYYDNKDIYIILDVKIDEKIDDINFKKVSVSDKNGGAIFDLDENIYKAKNLNVYSQKGKNGEIKKVVRICEYDSSLCLDSIGLRIQDIRIEKNKRYEYIDYVWFFYINLK